MTPLAAPKGLGRSALAAPLLLLTLALLPCAAAQGIPQPTLTLTLEETTVELGAANTTQIAGTLAYAESAADPTGAATATVTLALALPAGWTAEVDPPSAIQMTHGESVPITLTLTAPDVGAGDATGALALEATATPTGAAAGRSATATASVQLTRVDPPVVPTPFWLTPLGLALEIGIPAILIAGGVVLWRRNVAQQEAAAARAAYLARETGIKVHLDGGPREYGHRREVMYRLVLENVSDRSRVGVVEVAQVTNGWRAATGVTRVPLAAGERSPVTLIVTPDSVITPGDRATVVVRAKPEEARELDERVTIEVVAPKSGSPTDEHYKIVTVHREGANKGGLKPRR